MEFIIMDAALFDLLIEKLNGLVDKASKINDGKDVILEQWIDNQEVWGHPKFVKFWVYRNAHCKHYVIPAN